VSAATVTKIEQTVTAATQPTCLKGTVDLGSYCMLAYPYAVPPADAGLNNYFYATQKCAATGGWLPSAGQLIGAAPFVSLESVLGDNPTTAIVESDTTAALQDQREMSSTLVTTAAGSDAAGSEGVSVGATGNPAEGQPAPVPQPSNPEPATLQYVTVYDNHNKGGFAGSEPVQQPENFRCAFVKVPGGANESAIPGVGASSGGP
jgi:hypothetical protein